MGTDFVQLFQLQDCRSILSMNKSGMQRLLADRWNEVRPDSLLRYVHLGGTSGTAPDFAALDAAWSDDDQKREVVDELCLLEQTIPLDYWASYAEVFMDGAPGSISSTELFPNEAEETFILLLPEHVDRMLHGLAEHQEELRVMTEDTVSVLAKWRDQCVSNPNFRGCIFCRLLVS
jgi:hypothetical protein